MRTKFKILILTGLLVSCGGKVTPLSDESPSLINGLTSAEGWCNLENVRDEFLLATRINFTKVGRSNVSYLKLAKENVPVAYPIKEQQRKALVQYYQGPEVQELRSFETQKILMENFLATHKHLENVPNCFDPQLAIEVEEQTYFPCKNYSGTLDQSLGARPIQELDHLL